MMRLIITGLVAASALLMAGFGWAEDGERSRARDLGLGVGVLSPGPLNAITDVAGVRIGHITIIEGQNIRTGVTAVIPHGGNVFQAKVPAAIFAYNAFGKLAGSTQVAELGNIEAPIILTNTLSVGTSVTATVRYVLDQPGNEDVRSVNAVVGETNDGYLNDIRAQRITGADVIAAIESAKAGPVPEGAVGAGTGTRAFGYKGGIGTSSRMIPGPDGKSYTVGVLVQSNFGYMLNTNGVPFTREMRDADIGVEDGSCMIIIATDAPLDARLLERLARRAMTGLGRTRAVMSNGSGDYAIAFSTAYTIPYDAGDGMVQMPALVHNDAMTPLFLAVEEATQEAIYNSLFMATSIEGHRGVVEAIPLDEVLRLAEKYDILDMGERLDWRPYQ
jgi:D-aminopeptidase